MIIAITTMPIIITIITSGNIIIKPSSSSSSPSYSLPGSILHALNQLADEDVRDESVDFVVQLKGIVEHDMN